MGLKLIITGATGMVGEGIVMECLEHPEVEQVLVINRKPCGINHPKLNEVIHADFRNFSNTGVDFQTFQACFFCLGISSVGMKENSYREMTYDLTLHVAETIAAQNPNITFCYVSGAGTDSSEQGRTMWARVKGKTENDLLKLFKNAYMFRPGFIRFRHNQKQVPKVYLTLGRLLYPIGRRLLPKYISTIEEIGRTMIHVAQHGYKKHILEIKDIRELSKENQYAAEK